ncbi:MAG TPA: DMT family transporter [Streptosporangiaceae bacterium]
MYTVIAVVGALLAALCFALGSVVQQSVARQSGTGILRFRLLLGLVRQPRWAIGVLLAAGSFAIQGVALAFGPLTLVQPLAATDVLFALPLIARRNQRRLTRQDTAGALLITAGIVVFLTVSPPASGLATPSLTDWLPTIVAVAVVTGGSAVAAVRVTGYARVIWLAAASGCLYGLLDALTKSSVDLAAADGLGVLTTWEPYALAVTAMVGTLFGQSAFRAGPLSLSLPVIDSVEPVTAVVIGATVFGERLASSPALQAVQLAGGLVAIIGIFVMSRSSVVRTEAVTQANSVAERRDAAARVG